MGLDITAYSRLRKSDEPANPDYDYETQFFCRANSDFPGREAPLEDNALYTFGERFGFRAGSYGGYNIWRNELAKLAGWPAYPDESSSEKRSHAASAWHSTLGPFWELINFTDCDGVIGPTVAAKLALDFAQYQPKADAHADEYFRQKYADWRKAFEMAADNGAVDFH